MDPQKNNTLLIDKKKGQPKLPNLISSVELIKLQRSHKCPADRSHWKRMKESEGGANLPSFLSAKNYSSFISSELESAPKSQILYRTNTGATPAHGIRAELLPEICGVFLSARRRA
jgi:hypothetical protein